VDTRPGVGEILTGFILFNIDKEEYAVDIKNVNSILKTIDYQKIIFISRQELAFTIEYKNESFHILNLHKQLKHDFPINITNTRILLLNSDNQKTAIIVDNVKEFVTGNNKSWELLKVIPVNDVHYISGKIIYEGRNILIPDLNKINRDELLSLQLEKHF
jgi:chemotaxis signal transduction protein